MVEAPVRRQDQRVVAVRHLGRGPVDERRELALAVRRRELLRVEDRSSGMLGSRAGPLEAAHAVQPLVGNSAIAGRQGCPASAMISAASPNA